MTKLQEHLYQYIMEDRYPALEEDEDYRLVWQNRNQAEERLIAALTEEQRHLFNRYMDEENYLAGLQQRHVFLETLLAVHDMLSFR